eukprot:13769539-Alexandrium_andersonii.AAC.1
MWGAHVVQRLSARSWSFRGAPPEGHPAGQVVVYASGIVIGPPAPPKSGKPKAKAAPAQKALGAQRG